LFAEIYFYVTKFKVEHEGQHGRGNRIRKIIFKFIVQINTSNYRTYLVKILCGAVCVFAEVILSTSSCSMESMK